MIDIDIPNRSLSVRLTEEEMAKRRANLKPHDSGATGYLKKYATFVSSAAKELLKNIKRLITGEATKKAR